ncbi:MAG: hypothetical protein M3R24_25370 [Chloroflexota bacterium]|nr:hypothetical protein [Chloroflexota bacterium]
MQNDENGWAKSGFELILTTSLRIELEGKLLAILILSIVQKVVQDLGCLAALLEPLLEHGWLPDSVVMGMEIVDQIFLIIQIRGANYAPRHEFVALRHFA